eukprot:TRINITY_DN47784_c0_g1_i1.p1 TRINITY_DN47784_c0_g1~~TRINITY_DN47784_c0_g1_i1.p1  ORF type:complete len:109 (+),score=17.08 TRINITY_DN47784_c0_g1_i1:169-495(+)
MQLLVILAMLKRISDNLIQILTDVFLCKAILKLELQLLELVKKGASHVVVLMFVMSAIVKTIARKMEFAFLKATKTQNLKVLKNPTQTQNHNRNHNRKMEKEKEKAKE